MPISLWAIVIKKKLEGNFEKQKGGIMEGLLLYAELKTYRRLFGSARSFQAIFFQHQILLKKR